MSIKFKNEKELFEYAKKAKNIAFSDIDLYDRLSNNKGSIGQVMEESYFGYSVNSRHEADFIELGVELKLTPFRLTRQGYRAKERLVLGLINYCKENWDDFYNSQFWKKNQKLLIMFYEYKENLPREQWSVFESIIYKFPEEDLFIIKRDWSIISNKVKSGLAHELSEGDTLYLGACTKGVTAEKSMVKQPFSDIEAKQRAYSFKNSYMTYILNTYVLGNVPSEKIIKNPNVLISQSFESYISSFFNPYIGMNQSDLVSKLNIKASKSTNYSIIKSILKINGDLEKTEEFQKGCIIPKTIRIEENGNIKESMSFPTFNFTDFERLNWEDSEFYDTLIESRFMFIIFSKLDKMEESSIFKGVYFWSMPPADIDEASLCWKQTKHVIKNGVQLIKTPHGISNNLPKSAENRIAHVRPHSSKSAYRFDNVSIGDLKDANPLPDGRWMTKQCFWLNSNYIRKIIASLLK